MKNREYFQIFWALDNQQLIGELPPGVVDEVTKLWENCLRILADVIDAGVKAGDFAPADPWEVANILWTVANGLIQTEHVAPRRQLPPRARPGLDDTLELFLGHRPALDRPAPSETLAEKKVTRGHIPGEAATRGGDRRRAGVSRQWT
jgi:hypothetical protein